MDQEGPTEDLARVAHELWRRRMEGRGWKYGSTYDEAARTHDALVPWDTLGRWDREQARLAVESLELEELLGRTVDYPRGPERPFTPDEIRSGIPVTWSSAVARDIADPGAGPNRGYIESWDVGPCGQLTIVRVRWEDGTLSEHPASERDLRRLDAHS